MANAFGEQLRRFAEKTGEDLAGVDVGFKFDLFSRAVQLTPVDTGRLRGNWQITNGAPAAGVLAQTDTREGAPLDAAREAEIQPFSVTYLTNNMEYAPYVEVNTGMVGRAIAGAQASLARAVAEND